jgi:hypothetical protein
LSTWSLADTDNASTTSAVMSTATRPELIFTAALSIPRH